MIYCKPIVSALVFFVGYDVYAILTLFLSWFKLGKEVPVLSFIIKCVAAVIGNVSLLGYIQFSESSIYIFFLNVIF